MATVDGPVGNLTPTHIVGIGASAGGLEALERFFENTPADTGMAFVVVQHLSPDFKSLMDELLARWTRMPIHRVENEMVVQPNCIYLMPPKKEMIISEGQLLLKDKSPAEGLSLPIDQFFSSLAQDVGSRVIAVILSGTGSDGSRGVRAIRDAGGLVVVQKPETAKFDGMPRSAIETESADLVLSPEEMPQALLQYAQGVGRAELSEGESRKYEGMEAIFHLLRRDYGIDFSHYKPTTVTRRMERRMQMNRALDLQAYTEQLKSDRKELDALYRDFLIGVTRFFRDESAFQTLDTEVLPELLAAIPSGGEFRVWVAGCATGEEAYSLAILLREHLDRTPRNVHVKIFATDVHRTSLDHASAGVYTDENLAGVSPERLRRFFTANNNGYQISADIRRMVVFAPHNLIKDAPFTRLDLVVCRNLLIYLQPVAQKQVIRLFHFGLKTNGVLFLGPSESPGDLLNEFDVVDAHWKVYRKKRNIRLPGDLRLPLSPGASQIRPSLPSPAPLSELTTMDLFGSILDETLPPSFLVTRNRELIHTFGEGSQFLRFRKGKPSLDVLEMLDGDLKLAIAGALQRATRDQVVATFSGVHIPSGTGMQTFTLLVRPFKKRSGDQEFFLISLQPSNEPVSANPDDEINLADVSRERVTTLESELRDTRESLQATVEELQSTNEELQASNEELLASNEELQSTNEELHSVNEELYTVNAEYQKKISELTQLTADMENLLASTEVHTLFLDCNLCVRKYTPQMARVFHLIPQDVGRRIDNFGHNIDFKDLAGKMAEVLASGQRFETDVHDKQGNTFLMRILPYQGHKEPEGVVLTLFDVTRVKHAETRYREQVRQRDRFLAVLSHELRNPLAATLNAVQVLRRQATQPQSVQEIGGLIDRQASQMSALLNDLLDVSRITQGMIKLNKEVLDLGILAKQAIEAVMPLVRGRGHDVDLELCEEPVWVDGDPTRLRQVIENLLTNAIKYSPNHSKISLMIGQENGQVVVRVKDQGRGIPPEDLERIFEMFAQIQETLDRSDGGMGVGLTLVRNLVDLHGGTVSAHSEGLGKGSEFVIRLPRAAAPAPAPEQPPATTGALTIVLVEDNQDSRDMLAELLRLDGHQVHAAADGIAGVNLILERKPDVALVDIGLPQMDGYQVASRVRQHLSQEDIRLIALTGYGQEEDRQSALNAGFDDHIVKPVKPTILQKLLHQSRRAHPEGVEG